MSLTQDEIIRMAREAGLMGKYPFNLDQIERFAALVAAHIKTEDMAYEVAYLEGYEIGYVEGQQHERNRVK